MTAEMYNLALRQFDALDATAKVIVVHPRYVQQHTLLHHFITRPGAAYTRLCGRGDTADCLIDEIREAVRLQTGDTRLCGVSLLVIDECDCVPASVIAEVLRWLLPQMEKGRVALLGREVPFSLLNNRDLLSQSAIIPSDSDQLLWDYTDIKPDKILLEVNAFGYGQVTVNGRSINNWDGVLPRALFFYLVDRGMATRQDIFATFWPNLTDREATNVFHVTKRKVNEILGIDFTAYWSGFYRISPDIHLYYDVIRFAELAQNGEFAPDAEAEPLLEKAMQLYQGHYLIGLHMPWAVARRDELKQVYVDALVRQAEIKERQNQTRTALGMALRAFSASRQREDLALKVMRLYDALGMRGDALNVYNQLCVVLAQELGMSPGAQVQQYADQLKVGLTTSV